MQDKLQKMLAHAGLGSRREIEKWISDGRITVNGKRATLGDRASVRDRILVDGQPVALQSSRSETIKALMYHKPEGQICTRKDPQGRPTVFENLPSILGGRWVSVGRLDINTSGLILFTNNGELANKLMHPSTGLEREYLARIRGRASDATIKTLTGKGIEIDGASARFESVIQADMSEEGTNHWYRVVIKEGRYREVRRLWEAVGHTVSRLKRVRYGTIKLNRDLKQGKVTKLAPMQIEKLVNSVGLRDEFASQLYSAGQSTGAKNAKKRLAQAASDEPNKYAHKRTYSAASIVKKRSKKTASKKSSSSARHESTGKRDVSKFEKTMESGSGSRKRSKPARSQTRTKLTKGKPSQGKPSKSTRKPSSEKR